MDTHARGEKIWLLLLCWFLPGGVLLADCEQWAAKVVSVQGSVEARPADSTSWQPAKLDDTFCPGDSLQVGENSRAALVLPNETILRLDQNSVLTLTEVQTDAPSLLDLLKGIMHVISRVPRSLKVDTPYVNAAIEGTEFVVAVKKDEATITVFEGTVRAENTAGEVTLTNGESASAKEDAAPEKVLLATPRDAVQWALYFPPIIDPYGATIPTDELAIGSIREAQTRLAANDIAGAIASLDKVPTGLRDAGFHIYRASLFLFAGRVDAARSDLDRALTQDPANGNAMALQAIIAIVFNDRDEAQRLADAAVQTSPDSSAVHIAQSYVHQAFFDLPAALESAQKATELDGENALAWARVSELQLAQGYMRRALQAAETAAELNADLAIIQTTLGFAYLAQIRIKPATEAFEKAITQNQVNPLPRLGLGLAKIRRGKLADGRRDIEIAASLDPNRSIIRSYLGKAYFEEKRAPLDAEQYAIAKELDPNDPTPWFYDAIREQTENRPVEALQDIQTSIELNDNRAVYRSSLLLDQDEAVRGSSLARIYQDLDFDQLGRLEGTKSVNTDPSSDAAHRLLSDSYASLPRHDIARASELLQAQLFQDVNTTPLQPQLATTNLQILEGAGPSDPSFNEFNRLFTRNGVNVQFDVLAGNRSTVGNDLVVSGLHDKFSYSLGQFYYETDGYRENNDLKEEIYNVFLQGAVTPNVNLQAEYRKRKNDHGDLESNFDPEDFVDTQRETLDEDSGRLGLRFSPSTNSDLLISAINATRDSTFENLPPMRVGFLSDDRRDSDQLEAQYVFRQNHFNIIAGVNRYDVDVKAQLNLDFTNTPFGEKCPTGFPPDVCEQVSEFKIKQNSVYTYANLNFQRSVLWTLGAAYNDSNNPNINVDDSEVLPKLGVQWSIGHNLLLRAAYFETVKPELVAKQTLEPTQVSGFNQLYDDTTGTKAKSYGFALDARAGQKLRTGVEALRRDLDIPLSAALTAGPDPEFVTRRDEILRFYAYWTPKIKWSVSGEIIGELIDNRDGLSLGPRKLETTSLPLTISYFASNQIFAKLRATYVRQEVELQPTSTFDQTKEDFTTVDMSVGYRLPRRSGIIALEIRNIFDTEFLYQDLNFTTAEPTSPRFIPDRTVLARFTFKF